MPCAFDSAMVSRFVCGGFPHIVIIDSNGIVRGITSWIAAQEMQEFLDGKTPALDKAASCDASLDYRIPFNERKPYLMNGNGGVDSDFLFRSVLTKWDAQSQRQSVHFALDRHSVDNRYPEGYFQALGIPLRNLYKFAYFGTDRWNCFDTAWYGKYFEEPIIESKDSDLFKDQWGPVYKNIFCYSLIVPKEQATAKKMQQVMQGDLRNYFGFDVSIETRKFPCWKLVATDEARLKLRTAGGPRLNQYIDVIPRARIRLQNSNVAYIIRVIGGFVNGDIFDETGIEGNVDINLDIINSEEVQQSLRANGLSLVPIEKEMKVMVIRDPKEESTAAAAAP